MERYSQLLLAQKCINIRYSVYLLLNKFISVSLWMNRPSIYQKKLVHQSFWMFTLNEMRMKTMFSFRTHMNHSLCTSKVKNINFFFLFLIFLILITRNANGNNIYAIHESFMIQSWRRLNSSSNQSITFT